MLTASPSDFTDLEILHTTESGLLLKNLFGFFNLNGSHFHLKVAAMRTPTPEDDLMVLGQLQGQNCISPLFY